MTTMSHHDKLLYDIAREFSDWLFFIEILMIFFFLFSVNVSQYMLVKLAFKSVRKPIYTYFTNY